MILIVGDPSDVHVGRVRQALVDRSCDVAVIAAFDASHAATIEYQDGETRLGIYERTIDLDEVISVWWRVKPPSLHTPKDDDAAFVLREWRHFLDGLSGVLPHARWLNPRAAEFRFRHKVAQLRCAQLHGFSIPRTLVSNDPERIRSFVMSCRDRAVHKVLSYYFRPPDLLGFTTEMTADLLADTPSLAICPAIYQERVPRSRELRITVVGELVYAANVHSGVLADEIVDYRLHIFDVRYSPSALSANFQESLVAFHRSLGLSIASYDFIVTPEDKFVFLEVNPSGQWLWIEEATGLPITDSVAELISRTK